VGDVSVEGLHRRFGRTGTLIDVVGDGAEASWAGRVTQTVHVARPQPVVKLLLLDSASYFALPKGFEPGDFVRQN
jgi:hypothetical protein